MKRYNPLKPAKAFTLVELLVVIAILGILVSVLLPTLSSAREITYKTACQSNLRQTAIAVANYASAYKSRIPPNVHNANGVNPSRGPYRLVPSSNPNGANWQWEASNAIRNDKGSSAVLEDTDLVKQEYAWGGMGLLMATDFIPYTNAGLRAFWCPAERKYSFNGSTAGVGSGPNVYFKPAETNRWRPIGDISVTGSSYVYRALGTVNGAMVGIPANQNAGGATKWSIDFFPKRMLMMDACSSVRPTDNIKRFTHFASSGYQGYNRSFFDGSANWMRDPNIAWATYMPYQNGAYNTDYGNAYQYALSIADTYGL